VVKQKGKPKVTDENAYKYQAGFNTDLELLVESIVEETNSTLLKAFARHKVKGLIAEYGPVIVEAIREIQFIDIFNAQCKNVVASVISPGGSWIGEGNDEYYEAKEQLVPKTEQEQADKERAVKDQEVARAAQVEELQQQLDGNPAIKAAFVVCVVSRCRTIHEMVRGCRQLCVVY
jgi:hypothetical protein